MDCVKLAETIARKAHAGQLRKDGKTPYIVHPERVAATVGQHLLHDFSDSQAVRFSNELKAVAWLHDVIEDTEMTRQDLLDEGVPLRVVNAVEVISKLPNESYLRYLGRVVKNELALWVKQADILDNMNDGAKGTMKAKYELALFLLWLEAEGPGSGVIEEYFDYNA